MKLNAILISTSLAVASMFTVTAHADNTTRVVTQVPLVVLQVLQ